MTFDEAQEIAARELAVGDRPEVAKKWQEAYYAMSVHMEGAYPKKQIDRRRPNEPDEIKDFRKENYEPVTMSAFEQARDGLFRIFADAGDAINASDDLMAYINANNFEGTDFMSWVQSHLVPRMLVDPNAWAVVIPGGEALVRSTGRVSPRIKIIASDRVWGFGPDWLLWEGVELEDVGGQTSKVWWMLTDMQLIKTVQTGYGKDAVFVSEVSFNHAAEMLPAVQLGGIPKPIGNGAYYYESWFRAAVPFANEVVKQYSDWYASVTTAGYAIREMRPVECTANGCKNGKIYDRHDPTLEVGVCGHCKGTGYVPDSSPYGVYLQSQNPFDADGGKPPVIFHTPPTEPLQYMERAWQEMYNRLKEALHIKYVDEAQSGTAKMVDREAAYAQLLRISNHVWDTLVWTLLDAMERMRNRVNRRTPEVVKPTEFAMRTEADLVEELSRLRQSNVPSDFVMEIIKELIKKRYAGDELTQRKQMFLMMTDPLYDSAPQMEAFYFNAGIINAEQVSYSMYAAAILDQLIDETRPDPMVLFDSTDRLRQLIEERVRQRMPQQPLIPEFG